MNQTTQFLFIILGISILSGISALIYKLQEALNVTHSQRLKFLKTGLIVTWLVPMISYLIIYLRIGKAIGSLFPASENLNRALSMSSSRVLTLQAENSNMSQVIFCLYVLGLSIMALQFIIGYFRMRNLLLNSSAKKVGGRAVRVTDLSASPFSFGFFHPQIFIPSALAEKPKRAIEVILVHEEMHLRKRDPQWKLISLMTRTVLFFTPTAHFLHRKMDLEMEIMCDSATMEKADVTVAEYGNILLEAAAFFQGMKSNPMFAYVSDSNLKRRIQAMKAKTFYRPSLSVIFVGIIAIAGMSAVAAATGTSAFKGQYLVKADVLLNGKIVSSPQFIVLPNDPASLEMKSQNPESALRMMLTASDSTNAEVPTGIDLKMALEYKTQDHAFRANPHVVVMPGEDGVVTIASDTDSALELRIKAVRQ